MIVASRALPAALALVALLAVDSASAQSARSPLQVEVVNDVTQPVPVALAEEALAVDVVRIRTPLFEQVGLPFHRSVRSVTGDTLVLKEDVPDGTILLIDAVTIKARRQTQAPGALPVTHIEAEINGSGTRHELDWWVAPLVPDVFYEFVQFDTPLPYLGELSVDVDGEPTPIFDFDLNAFLDAGGPGVFRSDDFAEISIQGRLVPTSCRAGETVVECGPPND